jgi:hypothetical protein
MSNDPKTDKIAEIGIADQHEADPEDESHAALRYAWSGQKRKRSQHSLPNNAAHLLST